MAGRREGPLGPQAGPVARFAHGLRQSRTAAGGLTYRALAARAGYSVSTLAAAGAGDQLPSLAVTRAYVTVCGGDTRAWECRWHETARAVERLANAAVKEDDDTAPRTGVSSAIAATVPSSSAAANPPAGSSGCLPTSGWWRHPPTRNHPVAVFGRDPDLFAVAGDGEVALRRLSRPRRPLIRHPVRGRIRALRLDTVNGTLRYQLEGRSPVVHALTPDPALTSPGSGHQR